MCVLGAALCVTLCKGMCKVRTRLLFFGLSFKGAKAP